MKRKRFFYGLLIVLMGSFTSCEKEVTHPVAECSNMLYFENFEEYNNELSKVSKMNDEELSQWEKSKGFKSFGIAAERLYKSIDPESFKSVEEVKQFVAKNSDYLQLIEDGNGELTLETQLFNNFKKHIINEDKMYQIGSNIYKIYDEGVICTDLSNIENLKNLDYNMALKLYPYNTTESNTLKSISETPIFHSCASSNYEKHVAVDRDRMSLWVKSSAEPSDYVTNIYGNKYPTTITIKYEYTARPYKKTLGIWYWVASRYITCKIHASLHYTDTDGIWHSKAINWDDAITGPVLKNEDTIVLDDFKNFDNIKFKYEPIYAIASQDECSMFALIDCFSFLYGTY